jgi:hypothetical protein
VVRPLGLAAWIAPLGAAALVATLGTNDPADVPYFVAAARLLFSGHWADTFADPSLQVGPLQLLFFGAGDRIGGLGFIAVATEVGVAAMFVFTVGRLLGDRRWKREAQLAVGLAAVGLGITAEAYGFGHPAQVAVPLLWVLAGLDARSGRTLRGGALLGLGAGLELWGVLGLPVLLLAPTMRRALAGLAVQMAVTATLYLPFVFAGNFRMFDHRWKIESWSLVHLVFGSGDFPWTLRLVQGAAALAAGTGIALALRRRSDALWAVPLAVIGVRLLLDPTLYSWYWLGPATVALLAAADLGTRLVAHRRPTLTGLHRRATQSGSW